MLFLDNRSVRQYSFRPKQSSVLFESGLANHFSREPVLRRPIETAAFIGSRPPEPCSLAVGEARWDELCLPPEAVM
jgi:hypothetical protein